MTAYAYLRKSSVRNLATDMAPETQEREIRTLAARHGHDNGSLVLLSDWDVSGQGKYTAKRKGYLALVDAVESGRATAVYSYSLSRLGRSVAELTRFFAVCDARGVPLRLVADAIDTTTASGRLTANVLASVAQFEAEVASERIRSANAAKLARGERVGTARAYGEGPDEDAAAVLDAFREAGSYSGTAKLLNARGLMPRSSKRGWWPSAVAVVVKRLDPTIAAKRATRGYAAGGTEFTLARLLRCPTCGTLLTGTRDRVDGPNGGRVRYSCRLGSVTPHQRVSVSEHLILPAIRDEGAHLVTPDAIEATRDNVGRRAELESRRLRIIDLFESGLIDRVDRERRLASVHERLASLEEERIIQAVPTIDWDWGPRELNRVLTALFERVDLDPQTFQPVAFAWRVPEWRA